IEDTLTVGDGLCDRRAVELTVEGGPAVVERMLALGVRLDRAEHGAGGGNGAGHGASAAAALGGLELGREGGHSRRRIVHFADATGHEIQRALVAAASRHPNIQIIPDHIAVDLLSMAKYGGEPSCFGAYVLDQHTGEVKTIAARATVLATGGCGKVYVYTSNPDVATGDGIA